MWYFHDVLDRTDQQGPRAFASYPAVNTLGCIIALGDCWTYARESMRPSQTQSERADPTFRNSSPPLDSPLPSKTYLDVTQSFGVKGFGCLNDPESDK